MLSDAEPRALNESLGQALSCPILTRRAPSPQPHQLPSEMDVDGPSSSPPLRHTSLPPSSAPQGSSNGHNTPRRARPVADALALGDEDGSDMPQDDGPIKRRGRTRQTVDVDVPLVKDAVGESVRESFENFLRTYVCTSSQMDVSHSRRLKFHRRYNSPYDTCI